jgi:hypothetical protein
MLENVQETSWQRIELLRQRLYQIVDEHHGNLLHPRVIQASQKLDAEIALAMQSQRPRKTTLHRAVS